MSRANGAPAQPVAVVTIAMFADGNVSVQCNGPLNELAVRGMCGTAESLLMDLLRKKQAEAAGIEPATPDVARRLLGG